MNNNWFLRLLMITIIMIGLVSFAQAFDYNKLQWTEAVSGTLHKGENISYKEYNVTLISLPPPVESEKYSQLPSEPVEPFAGLNISKNGIYLNTTVLMPGSSFVLADGELQVTLKQLPSKDSPVWLYESYAPWATIGLNARGIPNIEVTVTADSADSQYISSTAIDIIGTVGIKNPGSADLFDVDVDVLTKLPIKRGDMKYHFEKIERNQIKYLTLVFSTPTVGEKKAFEIAANLTGYDAKDILYKARGTKTVNVVPEPLNIPILKKTTNQKTYLKDSPLITLTLKNNAKYELKNVSITDTVANKFKVVGNNSLHWTVNISAFGEWDAHYLIKPVEPGNAIALPAASAEFKLNNEYYIVQSNRPDVTVYGPLIALTKQIDTPEINSGDKVTVTVTGENTGTTPTKVTINDQLPPGLKIISGTTSKEEYLEAGKKVSFSYVIEINSKDPVRLPSATAGYYELGTMGTKINTSSPELLIRIKPEITPTPVIESTPSEISESTIEPTANEKDTNPPIIETNVVYETPAGPHIEEVKPKVFEGNIDTVMNLLLGCNISINNAFTASACSFVGSESGN